MAGFSHLAIRNANNLEYLEKLSRGKGANLMELWMLLPFPKSEASGAALRVTLMSLTCSALEDESDPGWLALAAIDTALESTEIKSQRLSNFRDWSALKVTTTACNTPLGSIYRWLGRLKLDKYYLHMSYLSYQQLFTVTEDNFEYFFKRDVFTFADRGKLIKSIKMLCGREKRLISLVAGLNESSDMFNIIIECSTLMESPIEPRKDGLPTAIIPRLVLNAVKIFSEVFQTYHRTDIEALIVFRYFLRELHNSPLYSASEKAEIKEIQAWVGEAYNSYSFKTNLPQPAQQSTPALVVGSNNNNSVI